MTLNDIKQKHQLLDEINKLLRQLGETTHYEDRDSIKKQISERLSKINILEGGI